MSAAAAATIKAILSHLKNVESKHDGDYDYWRADCPICFSKSHGSVSIEQFSDGRVVVQCYICQNTPSIIRAIGMEMADLDPTRIKDARRIAAEKLRQDNLRDAVNVVKGESAIVAAAAHDMQAGNVLSETDCTRLLLATDRITQASQTIASLGEPT